MIRAVKRRLNTEKLIVALENKPSGRFPNLPDAHAVNFYVKLAVVIYATPIHAKHKPLALEVFSR